MSSNRRSYRRAHRGGSPAPAFSRRAAGGAGGPLLARTAALEDGLAALEADMRGADTRNQDLRAHTREVRAILSTVSRDVRVFIRDSFAEIQRDVDAVDAAEASTLWKCEDDIQADQRGCGEMVRSVQRIDFAVQALRSQLGVESDEDTGGPPDMYVEDY